MILKIIIKLSAYKTLSDKLKKLQNLELFLMLILKTYQRLKLFLKKVMNYQLIKLFLMILKNLQNVKSFLM